MVERFGREGAVVIQQFDRVGARVVLPLSHSLFLVHLIYSLPLLQFLFFSTCCPPQSHSL